jgi:hypothetical protein
MLHLLYMKTIFLFLRSIYPKVQCYDPHIKGFLGQLKHIYHLKCYLETIHQVRNSIDNKLLGFRVPRSGLIVKGFKIINQ